MVTSVRGGWGTRPMVVNRSSTSLGWTPRPKPSSSSLGTWKDSPRLGLVCRGKKTSTLVSNQGRTDSRALCLPVGTAGPLLRLPVDRFMELLCTALSNNLSLLEVPSTLFR